jgi:uncharacterized membrane protein YesL
MRMFGKMMNSYYYGKSGKGDYRKEDLPRNRWQLFLEMLRIRFAGLMRLNLMYAVAWLPAILVTLYFVFALFTAPSQANEAGTAVEMTGEELTNFIRGTALFWLYMLIPAITITGPFTAGVSYVTRNWARDEHAFVWSDFKDAVKANWKQALIISFITSLMPAVLYICWSFYGQMAAQSPFFVVPQVLAIMLGVVWFLAVIYMYPLMVTYKLKFKDLIRNALLLSVGRLPQSLGLRILSAVPVLIGGAVLLFTNQIQWAMLGVLLYYVLIGFSLSRFIYASYTNAVFDRFINSRIEGAQVNRGLSQEEENDEEEEDE